MCKELYHYVELLFGLSSDLKAFIKFRVLAVACLRQCEVALCPYPDNYFLGAAYLALWQFHGSSVLCRI